jgi:hypothetical protein
MAGLPANPPAGTPVEVEFTLENLDPYVDIREFEFVLGWDTAQLSLVQVLPGDIFDIPGAFEWEQFEYSLVEDCIGDCPGGLVRVSAVADIDGDGHQPMSLILPPLGIPFTLEFETVAEAEFAGLYIPIQFFWTQCEDNSMKLVTDWPGEPDQVVRGYSDWVHNADLTSFWIPTCEGGLPHHCGGTFSCGDETYPNDAIPWIEPYSVFPPDWEHKPVALIDQITPSPANAGEPVSFLGHGTDPDGNETIAGYEWRSDIDGLLSSAASFDTDGLTIGRHLISFRVKDDDETWSRAFTALLDVGEANNTPVGFDVPVEFPPDAVITFENVTQAGMTSIAVEPLGPAPTGLVGIVPLGTPTYYDIQTTATYTGNLEIYISYDEGELTGDEADLRLQHYSGGEWINVTSTHDPDANQICGVVSALSYFALSEPCCKGVVGDANTNGDADPTIGDITTLVDAKFISNTCDGIIHCVAEADVNQSGGTTADCGDITIGDINMLVDYLFITGPEEYGPLPDCL